MHQVLEHCTFASGLAVAAFEEARARYCGVGHCLRVNSGTSALHLARIEDAAQVHGAEYEGRRAGGRSRVGCFRFYQRFNVLAVLHVTTREILTVTKLIDITSETVCELLGLLVRAHPGELITVVLDNARCHGDTGLFLCLLMAGVGW